MQPQFITKPAFTVVGMCIHTTAQSPDIHKLWQIFVPRMGEVQHLVEADPDAALVNHHVSYGLMGNYSEETGMFDYMAGEAVAKVNELPAGMIAWDVPANTYAVFEATLPTLGESFGTIYNNWLPASGYQQAAGPAFERYGETFNPDDLSSKMEIYVPVEKMA